MHLKATIIEKKKSKGVLVLPNVKVGFSQFACKTRYRISFYTRVQGAITDGIMQPPDSYVESLIPSSEYNLD